MTLEEFFKRKGCNWVFTSSHKIYGKKRKYIRLLLRSYEAQRIPFVWTEMRYIFKSYFTITADSREWKFITDNIK